MGIVYLLISKFATLGKMIAMKKCGKIASGPENSIRINLIRSFGCLIISVIVAFVGVSLLFILPLMRGEL